MDVKREKKRNQRGKILEEPVEERAADEERSK